VTDPTVWLSERLAEAPPALRVRVEAAMDVQRAGCSVQRGFGDQLRAAAEDLLTKAVAGPPTHETALTLLAADALITLACEWAGAVA
jgi:hypothetical protein